MFLFTDMDVKHSNNKFADTMPKQLFILYYIIFILYNIIYNTLRNIIYKQQILGT
jgi:hypothetical protein